MLMFQWLNILRYSRRVHIASICSTRMQSTNKSSAQNFLQNCYSKCFCFIAATAAATAFAASSEKKKKIKLCSYPVYFGKSWKTFHHIKYINIGWAEMKSVVWQYS